MVHGFEQHRMRLVELFDDLIELFETDLILIVSI